MTDKDKTKGASPLFSRTTGPRLLTPPTLPSTFLYFGLGQHVGHFDVLIRQFGVEAVHTQSVVCPCVGTDEYGGSGVAQPSCVACRGLGIAFVDEWSHNLVVLATAVTASVNQQNSGASVEGQIQVTFPSGYVVGEGDRLVFPGYVVPIQWKRKITVDRRNFYLPFALAETEILTAKGPRPDDPLLPLVRGRDYALNPETRELSFMASGEVKNGMVVSGSLMANPDYIIESFAHISRGRISGVSGDDNHVQFPRTATAVRADILINNRYRESAS